MSQELQLDFYRPKYRDQNGFLMPMGFPEEQFQPSLEYKPADSDIFIATYPKCGTTWMQYIVYLLKNKGILIRFLGAPTHLYNWLCPSVGWSVTHSF